MHYIWGTRMLMGDFAYEFAVAPFAGEWRQAELHRHALAYDFPAVCASFTGLLRPRPVSASVRNKQKASDPNGYYSNEPTSHPKRAPFPMGKQRYGARRRPGQRIKTVSLGGEVRGDTLGVLPRFLGYRAYCALNLLRVADESVDDAGIESFPIAVLINRPRVEGDRGQAIPSAMRAARQLRQRFWENPQDRVASAGGAQVRQHGDAPRILPQD